MLRFLAELSFRHRALLSPTPSHSIRRSLPFAEFAGAEIPTAVYELDISPPPKESYWLDWGGHFDNFTGINIELYFGRFLDRVANDKILLTTPYSYYIDTDFKVLMNIPMHPWLYPDSSADADYVIMFLSSALDPDNPSNNKLQGVDAKTLLEIPNFNIKLSDNISGVILNQGFNLNFVNNDGYFDNDGEWDLFNTPVTIKKAAKENPLYEDFRQIRRGLADNTITSLETFTVSVSDRLKNMDEPACNVIRGENYPNIAVLPEAVGKNIPVIYGSKKVELVKISDNPERYVGAEFISSVGEVYDRDGETIPHYGPYSDGTIGASGAATAVITGYTLKKTGEIIKDIINRKTEIRYHDGNWNTGEVGRYINICPEINIAFSSGNVREAVQNVLKSDMAYLIQQSDGRITIRKYGENYGLHKIPAWAITQKPEKDYNKAHSNYFSSCVINYNYIDKETFNSYLFEEMKNEAENRYRKINLRTFDTDLINKKDAENLARLLSGRFTVMKKTLKLGVAVDTAGFELLDGININMTVNGRVFTDKSRYIITEINPSQDIITAEEGEDVCDITGEFPDTAIYSYDFDNMYPQTKVFEYMLDGEGV